MTDPRLTEERLRFFLDGNQVARERMCLALLPLLGPFTQCRPRRPKGGPDGARDIECLCQGIPTWGAVGFRNGGGNDTESRKAAENKFHDDLGAALAENPTLESFVFFTNVDLTPGHKEALAVAARAQGLKTVHVFDMEALRNILDSPDGLLAREQYLRLSRSAQGAFDHEHKHRQSSKIASCYFPVRFPKKGGTNDVDPDVFVNYVQFLLESFCRCFGHTCVLTGTEDFVFLLTLEKSDRDAEPGFVPYDLELYCHITEFVRSLEERLNYLVNGATGPTPVLKTLAGDQVLEQRIHLGRNVSHRIYRRPPSGVLVEHVGGVPLSADKRTTTSALLCLLAKILGGGKVLIWDEIETYPDALKVMTFLDWIGDHGFTWDALRVDPKHPETWEYDCA